MEELLIDFKIFKEKRVLVTGHSGFKGSWLLSTLVMAGASVRGLSLPPKEHSHFESLGFLRTHGTNDFIDIRDFLRVQSAISDFNPEIIFHLAAQALVRESFSSPRDTFEVNVMGGVNLVEAARSADALRAIIFITSDKVYENLEWAWGYRENDRLGGVDPYSASKAAVELAVSSYSRSIPDFAGIPIVTTRAGNVIGGGDWSEGRLVPDVVRSVISQSPLAIRNPESTRPWQHVLEPISGYLLLAQRILEGERVSDSYNFGPDISEATSVIGLASGLLDILEGPPLEVTPDTENLHEAKLLQLNCDRAKVELGWSPRVRLYETIELTGEWYKNYMADSRSEPLTRNQISSYFKELS